MRKYICIILLLAFLSVNSFTAAATDEPVEIPDVRFIVNGSLLALSDVPLGLNGRTMLPLRAVLIALGVPNDDEHIKWNGEDGSVTVNYNSSSIYLKLNSETAYINGNAVELDAPPFGYAKNQRIYIPVRFIARAAGKDAAWDGYTKTVYLRDEAAYQETTSILEKTEAAMKAVVRAKIDTEMVMTMANQGEETGFNIKISEEQDRAAGILHTEVTIPFLENTITFSDYYKDNIVYSKGLTPGEWKKTEMEEKDFKKLFDNEMSLLSINNMDVLSATLSAVEGNRPEEIILSGNAYPKGIVENLAVYSGIEGLETEEYYVEIVVDRANGLLKSVFIEIGGRFVVEKGFSDVHAEIKAVYFDIDGEFGLILPDIGG
ncbi:MAG: copper amine oxidase N-terminal domain-containing protein [Ruminiclostridium sp.]|nr:copper amine oxidase N-terminal domain-containing protein [Ruminiclostridium sp.]